MDNFIFKVADALAYKSTFILFCFIAIVPLFFQMPHDILTVQQWLSQTFIQLVSLSILAIVSKIEGAKTAKILNETHDTVMQEFDKINNLISLLQNEISLQKDETTELHTILSELTQIQQQIINK